MAPPKPPIIGVLGGGQLGRMLQEQASQLGVQLAILDEGPDCPAKQVCSTPLNVDGSFKDPEAVRELARRVDVLTVEIEHVETEVLEEIATRGVEVEEVVDGVKRWRMKKVPCHPSWETLRLIQDKFLQKQHIGNAGVPVAEQMAIEGNDDKALLDALLAAGRKLGYPFMLKSRLGSYDGRGNVKVDSLEDVPHALQVLRGLPLYVEKYQPFRCELAVMVLRTEDDAGKLRAVHPYPVVETIHEDNICTKVFYPPRNVSDETCKQAQTLACQVARTFKGRGVFAVEMFLRQDDALVVNEVAPRPHNSGHYTIEAVPHMSQFRGQLAAILDVVPPRLELWPRVSAALMVNILGGATADAHDELVDMARRSLLDQDTDIFLHLYGKASKPGRKIGHITVVSHSCSPKVLDTRDLSSASPIERLTALATPLIAEVDRIRQGRLDAASHQLRPTATTTSTAPTSAAPASTATPAIFGTANSPSPLVVVTMGSDSDMPVLRGAFETLERFRVPYAVTITSAHRTPQRMSALARSAASKGVRVLIAAAGGAAALPGMLASETRLPVIGVPVRATHLDGQDSLLSIVQMPRGCPVATVGINNSTNAALLAVRIIAAGTAPGDEIAERLRGEMDDFMKGMEKEVEDKAAKLENVGWKAYLEKKA